MQIFRIRKNMTVNVQSDEIGKTYMSICDKILHQNKEDIHFLICIVVGSPSAMKIYRHDSVRDKLANFRLVYSK